MVCDSLERKWAHSECDDDAQPTEVSAKSVKVVSEREFVERLLERERDMFAHGFDPSTVDCGPAVLYR